MISFNSCSKKNIFFVVFSTVYLIFSFVTLDKYPAPFNEEAWMVEPAWHLLNYGELNSKMLPDWSIENNFFLSQGILEFLSYIPFIKLFGISPFSYRLPSLFSAILMLFYSYLLGKELGGKYTRYFSLLFVAVSASFFYASHSARASIYLGTLQIMTIYYLYEFKISNDHKLKHAMLAGIVGSLPIFFHWSGIYISIVGFIIFMFMNKNNIFNKITICYLLTIFGMALFWLVISVSFIGFTKFYEQIKFVIMSRSGNFYGGLFYNYFFVYQSKTIILELFAFILAAFIIIKNRLHSLFVLGYFVLFLIVSLLFTEQPSVHKAIVFIPMMICCAHASDFLIFRSQKKYIKTEVTFFQKVIKYVLIIYLSFSFFKQGILVKRHIKSDYPGYINRVKENIPAGITIMGDVNLWPGFVGRNHLIGGTFYLGRVISGWSNIKDLKPEPAVAEKFFKLLNDLNIEYMIVDNPLREQLLKNGIFKYDKNSKLLKKVAHFSEPFYSSYIFGQAGDIEIYKINYPISLEGE